MNCQLKRAANRFLVTGWIVAVAASVTSSWAADEDVGAAARVVWSAHVEQIFADHCTKCHAGVKQKGGVDLRTPQTVLKGGDDGAIVIPGKPEESPLMKALRVDSDPHMPPEGSKQLTEDGSKNSLPPINRQDQSIGARPPTRPRNR